MSKKASDTGAEYLESEAKPKDEKRADYPNLLLGQKFGSEDEKIATFKPPKYKDTELPPVKDDIEKDTKPKSVNAVIAEVEQNPIENPT